MQSVHDEKIQWLDINIQTFGPKNEKISNIIDEIDPDKTWCRRYKIWVDHKKQVVPDYCAFPGGRDCDWDCTGCEVHFITKNRQAKLKFKMFINNK